MQSIQLLKGTSFKMPCERTSTMPATFTKSALMLSLLLGLGQAHAASQSNPDAVPGAIGILHRA